MNSILSTDLYQLTMGAGFYQERESGRKAIFHFFIRKNPFNGGFSIFAGLEDILEFVENTRFEREEIEYLASLSVNGAPLFNKEYLDFLIDFRFNVDIHAMEEGTPFFPWEPVIRITGPLFDCQLLETYLSTLVNHQSLIATKSARIFLASNKGNVLEFGLRRAHGHNGGLSCSRAAYIGGCSSTSNVAAGFKFGIPVVGTHSHSWVQSHENELSSFIKFCNLFPQNKTLLVDTYKTLEGVKEAIAAAASSHGDPRLRAIRLDSGDLAYLSSECRKILDNAGLKDTKIIASNDLDEYIVSSLIDQEAKIDVWAVGTKLVTAYDQPALGGVFKLSAIIEADGKVIPKIKLSEDPLKISIPGSLQVERFYGAGDKFNADMIFDEFTSKVSSVIRNPLFPSRKKNINTSGKSEILLKEFMRRGVRLLPRKSLDEIRTHCLANLNKMDKSLLRFINPHNYPAGIENNLYKNREKLIQIHSSVSSDASVMDD